MGVLTEVRVDVSIVLVRTRNGADHAQLRVVTYDAAGNSLRSRSIDILPQLSPARQAGIQGLLDDAIAYVKSQLDLDDTVVVGPNVSA